MESRSWVSVVCALGLFVAAVVAPRPATGEGPAGESAERESAAESEMGEESETPEGGSAERESSPESQNGGATGEPAEEGGGAGDESAEASDDSNRAIRVVGGTVGATLGAGVGTGAGIAGFYLTLRAGLSTSSTSSRAPLIRPVVSPGLGERPSSLGLQVRF